MDYSDFVRTFTQADTHIFAFQVYDEIAATNTDITAWPAFWLTAKAGVGDADPGVFQLTLGSGLTFIDPLTGLVEVIIPRSATAALDRRRYALVADIQGKDAAGNIWTLLRGQFIILPEVTRAVA